MEHKVRNRKKARRFVLLLIVVGLLGWFSGPILGVLGGFLVVDEAPIVSDAVVVLNTGMEIYPRLIEAARLYREKYTEKVVINGNRKTSALRALEKAGYTPCCPWPEDSLRILELLGVPRQHVISISAEDAYDTVSEAQEVGGRLADRGVMSVIITTSRSHSGRARYIWNTLYRDSFAIRCVAANDSFSPSSWYKDGRQIKIFLYEYGSWLFYFWRKTASLF